MLISKADWQTEEDRAANCRIVMLITRQECGMPVGHCGPQLRETANWSITNREVSTWYYGLFFVPTVQRGPARL